MEKTVSVMVRMLESTRVKLNADARASGIGLQEYCERLLCIPAMPSGARKRKTVKSPHDVVQQ